MPRAVNYKANSVIYFAGDTGDKIYILQSGRTVLRSRDIETGDELVDAVQVGEFFGVRSALGRYPREDDAMVITDSQVLVFTVPEFEQLAARNTRIVIKMLKVFSNQLRRIGQKVRNQLAEGKSMSPEDGLYSIGQYYLENKLYKQALYVLGKYKKLYPNGQHIGDVNKYLPLAEQYAQQYGQGKGPALVGAGGGGGGATKPGKAAPAAAGPEESSYYEAVTLVGQNEFAKAMEKLKPVIAAGEASDKYPDALFEVGRCLFGLGQYDKMIKHYQGFLQSYPEFEEKGEVLFLVGQAYEKSGDKDKAKGVYTRLGTMGDVDDTTKRKAKKALTALGA